MSLSTDFSLASVCSSELSCSEELASRGRIICCALFFPLSLNKNQLMLHLFTSDCCELLVIRKKRNCALKIHQEKQRRKVQF